jgi:hypothetical protein
MEQIKTDSITAIYPDTWPTWSFVQLDHCTYKDNGWSGCDYRIAEGSSEGLAINIYLTGRDSKWNGVTFETRARIEFVGDGEPSTFVKGKVYSTNHLFSGTVDPCFECRKPSEQYGEFSDGAFVCEACATKNS